MSIRQQRIKNNIRTQARVKFLAKTLLGLTIIMGIGCFLLFLYFKINMLLINVEVVKYGELEEKAITPAILMKQETIVKAPAQGRFENQIMEGERVKRGSVAGQFYSEGKIKPTSLLVPVSGIISFNPDGWEDVLSKFSLDHGDQNIFDYNPRIVNDGTFQYEEGEPLFKIIDNLTPPRMIVTIDPSEPLNIDDKLSIRYQNRYLGNAVCQAVFSQKGRQTAILGLSDFDEALLNLRQIEVEYITDIHKGLIISEKCLVENQTGFAVYRIKKGKIELQNIEVLAIVNDQAIVKGLETGDSIVTTPGLVAEGMAYR